MAGTFVITDKKYAVFVQVLAGQGDGPLITIGPDGKIHKDHGDPGQLRGSVTAAVRQIEAGVEALHAAVTTQAIHS